MNETSRTFSAKEVYLKEYVNWMMGYVKMNPFDPFSESLMLDDGESVTYNLNHDGSAEIKIRLSNMPSK